jgi:hypothetical protein
MTRIADLRRRFDAISHAFSGTIAAKLIKLTDDQRLAYNDWRDRMAIFCASYPDGEAYARIINGDAPPPLRRDVQMALFGAIIGIPLDATDAQASEIYRRAALGD